MRTVGFCCTTYHIHMYNSTRTATSERNERELVKASTDLPSSGMNDIPVRRELLTAMQALREVERMSL